MRCINKAIVDLRREACTGSERVSQALFGTRVEERQRKGDWCLIQTPDGYHGFVEDKHLSESLSTTGRQWKVKGAIALVRRLSDDAVLARFAFDTRFSADLDGERLMLALPTGEPGYVPREAADFASASAGLAELERLARALVGTPYLWGGTSPFGFDCSGFVQCLFHYCSNGWLPRDTAAQRHVGEPVAVEALKRGDLCFFPGHVAVYTGDGAIIHSNRHHNAVSIDQLLEPTDGSGAGLLRDFQGARRVSFEPLT